MSDNLIYEYAQMVHSGQGYNGKPYFDAHLIPVAEKALELHNMPMVYDIALVHDLREDHPAAFPFLEILIKQKYGGDAVFFFQALDQLTRTDDLDYYNYIMEITSPFAVAVKLADLEVNIATSLSRSSKFRKLPLYLFARDVMQARLRQLR